MNIDKLFHFISDKAFKARYVLCVSAVNIELNFGGVGDSVRFPVIAAIPTPISFLKQSVYKSPYSLYLFLMTSLNIF